MSSFALFMLKKYHRKSTLINQGPIIKINPHSKPQITIRNRPCCVVIIMDTPSAKSPYLDNLIFFPNLEEFNRVLPRRKKQRSKDACCGLSTASWVFLLLALLQG
jgi:hypothetical protein